MTSCRACRSGRLYKFLSLGEQPPANAFLRRDQLELPEARWPLDAHVCLGCGLIQIPKVLRPDFYSDYVYAPSTSGTTQQHCAELAGLVLENLAKRSNDLVIDIGSSDGLFLWKLIGRGGRGLGIEPAGYLADIARERGVEVVNRYFSPDVAADVRSQYGTARVITITNSFNHIDDLHSLMSGVTTLLDPEGTVIVEVPYGRDRIENNEFDTICHEHVSEFTVKSLVDLFGCFDLAVVDIVRLPIHGGSMRVFGRCRTAGTAPAPAVGNWLAGEDRAALHDVGTYDAFAERVHGMKRRTLELLDTLRGDGRRIAGYGAPPRGNTLLNFYGLGPDMLAYLADLDTLKHGLFSPGMHIPVVPVDRILQDQPDYLLVLAWNCAGEIMRQQREFRRRGGSFLLPIPAPRVAA